MTVGEINERLCIWLERRRVWIAAVVVIQQFLLHFLFIGFPSWDGLTYRVPPIVELVQHGSLGLEKYNQWAFQAYFPFIELAHAPFVALFKLRGALIGFPLVVLPLCILAVHAFIRQLTGSARSAFFGTAAYVALPLVSEGAFSGYVDFAVCALLCFFLFAVLRAALPDARGRDLARLVIATLAFSLCRGQAIYISTVLLAVLLASSFLVWANKRPRIERRGQLARTVAAFAVGGLPAMGLQVFKYVTYGSPIYPYQFQVFGRTLGTTGVTMKALFSFAGIPDDTPSALLKGAVRGWLWPDVWPPVGFYDSRNLGAGLVMWIAILTFMPFARNSKPQTRALVACLAILSVLARDFCHPRWACTLLAAVIVVVGIGMARLAEMRVGRWAFVPLTLVLFAHGLRPELELLLLKDKGIGPRLNAGGSPWFVRGPHASQPWPDLHAKLLIVQEKGFVLPVYGVHLTNEVIRTIPGADVGTNCEKLVASGATAPNVIVLDDLNFTKTCRRECVVFDEWYCAGWRISETPASSAPPL